MSSADPSDHSRASRGFVDAATECAICLSPLSDEETITLLCGHAWHLRCIKEQLRHAEPNPSKRLLFSGCRCPKCGVFCDHPLLETATRSTTALRDAVDALIQDQIQVDGVATHPQVESPTGAYAGDPLALGRSLYAFFQCVICKNPYFGGTVACADDADDILPPADRMCPTCAPGTSVVCGHNTHTPFHVWKCRYCCRSSNFVCYGTTHFCDECHERDRRRAHGTALPAIECPGAPACRAPLPSGQSRHSNGATHTCEQILRCTLCASDPTGVGARTDAENLSPNMVFNPSATHGLRGWTKCSHMSWKVERSQVPFRNERFNFVSGHSWCVMAQVIPLSNFLARPGDACLEVSARYMARTDCASRFAMDAVLYSSDFSELAHFSSGRLSAPADYWEPVKHIFNPQARAAYLVIAVRGTDERTWAGEYGSKCTDLSLRVRFSDSTADESVIAIPEAFGRVTEVPMSSRTGEALRRFMEGGSALRQSPRVHPGALFDVNIW